MSTRVTEQGLGENSVMRNDISVSANIKLLYLTYLLSRFNLFVTVDGSTRQARDESCGRLALKLT